MTSYIVIIPFWSMAGTSFHMTSIKVGEVDIAETVVGGLAGAVEKEKATTTKSMEIRIHKGNKNATASPELLLTNC